MTHTAACIISFGICTACGAAFAAFALPELPDKAQGSILLLPALLLSAWAMLMLAGGTADELAGGSKAFAALRHTNSCYFTMVAVENGKPVPVPPLELSSEAQKCRFEAAEQRKKLRLQQAEAESCLPCKQQA